jgi:hypothetical protein
MPFSRTYYYSDVKVLLFEKKFKSVTGLTKSNPLESPACDLTAEFTYAIEFSPFAHLLSNNLPGQVSNSRACFKLYDDGWRLLEIDS